MAYSATAARITCTQIDSGFDSRMRLYKDGGHHN